MSTFPKVSTQYLPAADSKPEPDLIDRIAAALPAEIRADYYREMRHCRLLPENDEMLRILRIMQFLTLLIEQAPTQVAVEREQLGRMLAQSLEAAGRMQQANLAYYKQLEERIAKLPAAIEQGISPEAIAARLNEALRQQFAQSGLPQTAKALDLLANQVKVSTRDFQQTASELTGTYKGVADQASQAMAQMVRSIESTTYYSQHAQEKLAGTFFEARKWLIVTATSVALVLGIILGGLLGWYFHTPASVAAEAPAIQTTPLIMPDQPAASEAPVAKTGRKKHKQPQPESAQQGLATP